jgi:Protein of unknown function (DUF2889)
VTAAIPLDSRHGTHEPTTTTPARRPKSVRRTTTTDATYPEGPGGPLHLDGRGRDVVTPRDASASPTIADEATVQVDIRYEGGPRVAAISTQPDVEVSALVGRIASSGFRAAIDAETPALPGRLAYQLLDEIPAATLVAGYSVMHALRRGDLEQRDSERRRPPGPMLQVADLCAGWQTGGVIMTDLQSVGAVPHVTGPVAPDVSDPTDPWAWHKIDLLPPNGMRRRRRIDVIEIEDGTVEIDALFRDSHMAPDGHETVLHEYTIHARVDPFQDRILECRATPQVLPWVECPQAAASASRLAGTRFSGLRQHVRAEFVGPSTCTHLNDTLRALEDTPHLITLLPRP